MSQSALVEAMRSMVQSAFSDYTFTGTVASVAGGLVYVLRPGHTSPDQTGYASLVNPAALPPGTRVTVLRQGASYVIQGALPTPAPAPPALPTPTNGVFLGVWQPDPVADGSLVRLATFEADSGRQPSLLVGLHRDFASQGTIPYATLTLVRAHGSIPFLTWSPMDTTLPPSGQAAYALANIIAGTFDAYLTAQAGILAAYASPVFVRLMHEMNATGFEWAGNAPLYVLAWRHIHDLVAAIAPNVLWVWCPLVWNNYNLTATDPSPYYPGDSYVDWVGLDGYNSATLNGVWQSFTATFGFSYAQLLAAHPKPLLLGEWGCDEDPRKAAWLSSALGTELPSAFPAIKAENYTNEDQRALLGLGANWSIESDSAAQAAFAAGIAGRTYLSATG